jgi:SP family sugar:H+ symporter-like MFS transporter
VSYHVRYPRHRVLMTVVVYYGATIFQSVGIQDAFVTQLILGAVNFISTFGGIYVMERFGRRWPLIIGGVWQSLWLFVFAAVGTAKDPKENQSVGYVMIISACLFILGYATTWAPGVWIIIGETFPTRTRKSILIASVMMMALMSTL